MKNHHSMKWLHHTVCLINALAALHIGLMALNYNFLAMGFLAGFARPIAYLFGLSGLTGLIMWVMHTFFCDCSSCKSGSVG